MERIREIIEVRKSKVYERIGSDKKCTNDPIIGRFMEGKVVAERDEFEFYEKLLEELDNDGQRT